MIKEIGGRKITGAENRGTPGRQRRASLAEDHAAHLIAEPSGFRGIGRGAETFGKVEELRLLALPVSRPFSINSTSILLALSLRDFGKLTLCRTILFAVRMPPSWTTSVRLRKSRSRLHSISSAQTVAGERHHFGEQALEIGVTGELDVPRQRRNLL